MTQQELETKLKAVSIINWYLRGALMCLFTIGLVLLQGNIKPWIGLVMLAFSFVYILVIESSYGVKERTYEERLSKIKNDNGEIVDERLNTSAVWSVLYLVGVFIFIIIFSIVRVCLYKDIQN